MNTMKTMKTMKTMLLKRVLDRSIDVHSVGQAMAMTDGLAKVLLVLLTCSLLSYLAITSPLYTEESAAAAARPPRGKHQPYRPSGPRQEDAVRGDLGSIGGPGVPSQGGKTSSGVLIPTEENTIDDVNPGAHMVTRDEEDAAKVDALPGGAAAHSPKSGDAGTVLHMPWDWKKVLLNTPLREGMKDHKESCQEVEAARAEVRPTSRARDSARMETFLLRCARVC